MKNVNLAGKSKVFLVMLLVWQVLKLLIILGGCIAVLVGAVALAGIPMLLIGLGALLVLPKVNASHKRRWIAAWW